MKQNILFAIALFTLSSTVTSAADPQQTSPSEATPTPALVEGIKGLSPKKAKPAPLNFPADFGSAKSSGETQKEVQRHTVSDRIKHSVVQLGLNSKEIALQTFTYENMNAVKVFVISTTVTCVWAVSEVMKWFFNMLNSLRVTYLTPKPIEIKS